MTRVTRATDKIRNTARPAARGFTLIELLVSITILGIIMSLLLLALRGARNAGQAAGERQSVAAVKMAVVAFKDRYGFLPPLIKDVKSTGSDGKKAVIQFTDPTSGQVMRKYNVCDTSGTSPQSVKDLEFLRHKNVAYKDADERYSLVELPYYLIGACDVRVFADPAAAPIDGVAGPGFMTPSSDGTYKLTAAMMRPDPTKALSLAGKSDPMLDIGKASLQLIRDTTPDVTIGEPTATELRNRKGQAYRYYRWLPDEKLQGSTGGGTSAGDSAYEDLFNIPIAVADWDAWKTNPQLREARYAIVLPGADGIYGDEEISELANLMHVPAPSGDPQIKALRSKARADNIVEVGK